MDFSVDLSGLHPEVAHRVIKQMQHEDRARFDLDRLEQLRLKKLHDAMVQPGWNNEIGPQVMCITPGQWAAFMHVYGQRCWADPDFRKWVLKQPEHQDFKVKEVGTRVQSGWTAGSPRGEVRRTK